MNCQVCGQFRGRKPALNCKDCSAWAKRTFRTLCAKLDVQRLVRWSVAEDIEIEVL